MGFGSAGSMNVILKNNRNLLNNHRRKKFKNTLGSYASNSKPEFDFPDATPQILRKIRERLTNENRQRRYRIYVVFAFVMVSLVSIIIHYA